MSIFLIARLVYQIITPETKSTALSTKLDTIANEPESPTAIALAAMRSYDVKGMHNRYDKI